MSTKEKIAYLTVAVIMIVILIAVILIDHNARSLAQDAPESPRIVLETETINYTPEPTNAQESPTDAQETATEAPTETPTEIPTEIPTEVPTEVPTEIPADPTPEVHAPVYLKFLATAYSSDPAENGGWGANDCKKGTPLPSNAIAANLNQLPYGTRVWIKGFGEKVVVDTASQKTINMMEERASARDCVGWIDVYYGDNKQGAKNWGVQVVEIIILEWGDGK